MVKAVFNVAEFTKLMLHNCIKVVRLTPDQPNQWLRACVGMHSCRGNFMILGLYTCVENNKRKSILHSACAMLSLISHVTEYSSIKLQLLTRYEIQCVLRKTAMRIIQNYHVYCA